MIGAQLGGLLTGCIGRCLSFIVTMALFIILAAALDVVTSVGWLVAVWFVLSGRAATFMLPEVHGFERD